MPIQSCASGSILSVRNSSTGAGTRLRGSCPLEGNALPIAWVWKPETIAWLVIGGGGSQYPEWQEWSRVFPGTAFPRAEGAILRHLDPLLWGRMAETIPRPAS